MNNGKLIKDIIIEQNKKAIFLKDYFNEALIGNGFLSKDIPFAIYDASKCVEIIIEKKDMDELDAYEYFWEKIVSKRKENGPIFINDLRNMKEIKDIVDD